MGGGSSTTKITSPPSSPRKGKTAGDSGLNILPGSGDGVVHPGNKRGASNSEKNGEPVTSGTGEPTNWVRIPDSVNATVFPEKVFGARLVLQVDGKKAPDWTVFDEDDNPSFYTTFTRTHTKLRRRLSMKEIQENSAKYRAGELEKIANGRSNEVGREALGEPVEPEEYLQHLHDFLRQHKNTYRFIDGDGEIRRLYETASWHQLRTPRLLRTTSRQRPSASNLREEAAKSVNRSEFNPAAFYVKTKFEPQPILRNAPMSRHTSLNNVKDANTATSPSKIRSRVSFTRDTEYHEKTRAGFSGGGNDDSTDELPDWS